jgi:TP53 regulating kinase-like protein
MLADRSNWVAVKRGAEASIWRMTLFGEPCIAKVAEPKPWRAAVLDECLRAERIQNEARSNLKCLRLGIPIAPIVFIDRETSTIVMRELTGPTVKQFIFDNSGPELIDVMKLVGRIVADLHNNEMIHSDLTTSNFMLHGSEVRVIDFGLSFISSMAEDKAVDLYVLERAFISSHPGRDDLLDVVMKTYISHCSVSDVVMKRLKKVRSRGRKRSMVG